MSKITITVDGCDVAVDPAPAPAGGRFLGEIFGFSGSVAPATTTLAQGQTILVDDKPALFAVIGNEFGGDGITDFKLPDFRGRVPIGAGAGAGGSLSEYVLGEKAGVETHSHGKIPAALSGIGATGNNPTGAYVQGGEDIWSTTPATLVDTAVEIGDAAAVGALHTNIQPVLGINVCIVTG